MAWRINHSANGEIRGRVWEPLKLATRVGEGQIEAGEHLAKRIADRIIAIEKEIENLSTIIEADLKGNSAYEALLTVPGVGPKAAAQLVLTIAIEDFEDHNSLASYVGLAPKIGNREHRLQQ